MSSFDLVPGDYRANLALTASLRQFGIIIIGLVIITLASGAAFAFVNKSLDAQIKQLQTQHAVSTQQRNELESLDGKINELHRQWQLLTTLRSGAPAEGIFAIIDAAMADTSIWFQHWAFIRKGNREQSNRNTVNTGYFIVVANDEDAIPTPAWDIETHIKIKGKARDHAALSRFVRGLFERDEVSDVRVQNSTLQRHTSANVVNFELAVILDGEESN